MRDAIDQLAVYLYLANAAWKKLRMPDRDRLLVISAVLASEAKLELIGKYCRHLILKNNPGHMLRKWQTVEEALLDVDFLYFFKQVFRRFPIEKAETILSELGIDPSNERATYYSDLEYAASLLGVDVMWLEETFGKA